jgi:hypothetical protein
MGLIELIITVCAVAQPDLCEDQHLQFADALSPAQCTMAAMPYIARWVDDHPKWRAVRWRCDYPSRAT